jgi:hypothetical protein
MLFTPGMKALLAVAILFGLAAPASAGGRVDWSAYIDPNAGKPVATHHVAKTDKPARSTKKATRARTKIAKGKAVKARSKHRKARR